MTSFHIGLSVEGVLSVCSNGSALLNKIATMPMYGKKTLKNLLWNQESFEAESWYIASGTQGLLSRYNATGMQVS